MESKTNSEISINIPNYSGPLETLLELAKAQKVDLAKISITELADQFSDFIKNFNSKVADIKKNNWETLDFCPINYHPVVPSKYHQR